MNSGKYRIYYPTPNLSERLEMIIHQLQIISSTESEKENKEPECTAKDGDLVLTNPLEGGDTTCMYSGNTLKTIEMYRWWGDRSNCMRVRVDFPVNLRPVDIFPETKETEKPTEDISISREQVEIIKKALGV